MPTVNTSDGRTLEILSAKEIYDKLVNDFNIIGKFGVLSFKIGDCQIETPTKDIVGKLLEDWVYAWLVNNNIYAIQNKEQTSPDVFLIPDDTKKGRLEIKAFYRTANFDVADFKPFCESLADNIWVLDEDFLIFKYDVIDGKIIIKNLYLKKLWQICGYSKDQSIRVQAKNGQIHKIRPVAWYSEKADYKSFPNISSFLSALKDLYFSQEKTTNKEKGSWVNRIRNSFQDYFDKDISIPDYQELSKYDKSFAAEINKLKKKIKKDKASYMENSIKLKNILHVYTDLVNKKNKVSQLLAKSDSRLSSGQTQRKSNLKYIENRAIYLSQRDEIDAQLQPIEKDKISLQKKQESIHRDLENANRDLANVISKRKEIATRKVY